MRSFRRLPSPWISLRRPAAEEAERAYGYLPDDGESSLVEGGGKDTDGMADARRRPRSRRHESNDGNDHLATDDAQRGPVVPRTHPDAIFDPPPPPFDLSPDVPWIGDNATVGGGESHGGGGRSSIDDVQEENERLRSMLEQYGLGEAGIPPSTPGSLAARGEEITIEGELDRGQP